MVLIGPVGELDIVTLGGLSQALAQVGSGLEVYPPEGSLQRTDEIDVPFALLP